MAAGRDSDVAYYTPLGTQYSTWYSTSLAKLKHCTRQCRLCRNLEDVTPPRETARGRHRHAQWWRNALRHVWDKGCKPFSYLPGLSIHTGISCLLQMLAHILPDYAAGTTFDVQLVENLSHYTQNLIRRPASTDVLR